MNALVGEAIVLQVNIVHYGAQAFRIGNTT
jgi:hypothetical protein